MSSQRLFLSLILGSLAFGGWLLTLQSQDSSPKSALCTTKYIVQQIGDGALMLDPLNGKTWMLRGKDNGNAIWLPIPKIDSEKETSQLWLKTVSFNLRSLNKNEQSMSPSAFLKERGYVSVPLDKLNCGYYGVQIRINREKVYVVLDSGQPVTHLEPIRITL